MFNNDVVGSSVIGAPLYNSNNETNPETSGWSNSVNRGVSTSKHAFHCTVGGGCNVH